MQTSVHAISGIAKVTIVVVDEYDRPIEGASVGIGFQYDKSWATDVRGARGLTDEKGKFSASNSGNGYIGYGARKDGYYESSYRYQFEESSLAVWKPWNPELKVVLRKIENPVPTYARDTVKSVIEIPVIDREVGFDLIAFDWVAPYGIGLNSDFIFKVNKRMVNNKDFEGTFTLTFPNKFDGILVHQENRSQGSLFKLPRFAPEKGYENLLVLKEWRKPTDYNVKRNFDFVNEDYNYFFRVRSEEKDGKLVKAMYGKISGPIDFTVVFSKTAKIYFTYYLNPDNTRNLEFDSNRNHLSKLPDREQVSEP
jgi:hypothetical protein